MKRALLCLLALFSFTALFASSSYTDSLEFLSSYPKYVDLYASINNCASASEVDAKYESLKDSLGNSANDWTVMLKASLNYAHYCLEIAEKKNSKKAKQLISNAEAIYEALEESGLELPESNLKALKFSCLTIGYLASPISISKGLESIKVIDGAYEEYPQEVEIALLYAARKLNAPSIGGGDSEEAYEVLTDLLAYIESDAGAKVHPWTRFDIYSNLAKCYEKKKDKARTWEMYNKALAIYPRNKAVIKALESLQK